MNITHPERTLAAALCGLCLLAACAPNAQALTRGRKLTIERITSIFENSTPEFRYDYIEDIEDGAGITCGRVGFTVGELLLVTERYMKAKGPEVPLAAFIPCLKNKGEDISKDYSCLYPSVPKEKLATAEFKREGGLIATEDFGKAWISAGADPVMRKIQDDYVEETYFQPAVKTAGELGLHTPLALAFIYDAVIQMDTEVLFADISARFAAGHHGRSKPRGIKEEGEWLRLYIPERKKQLSVTAYGATTTPRVDSLAQLLDDGNFDLDLPIKFTYFAQSFTLK